MQTIDIARWAGSLIGFYVDRHYDADEGRWVLQPGPIRLAPYHADVLRHLFTPGEDGRLPYDVVGWCEPAKSGKSAIAGLVAQYMGLHGDPNSAVVLASNKQDQARSVMYASFQESVKANPALGVVPGRTETTFPNGCTVKAIPSSAKGEAGARFSLALFDELWGYVHLDAERLWSEFKTDPTRLVSLKMAVGYAGYVGESQLWQELLEHGQKGEPVPELANIANDDGEPACWRNGRTFVFWSHVCRQPWQTLEWIAEQRKALRPPEFARMILTEFAEGQGDFCDPDDWAALIDPEHKPLPLVRGSHPHIRQAHQLEYDRTAIYVGLDLALSPKGDDCALIGLYRDGDLAKVAFHALWKGKDRREELKLGETVWPYLVNVKRNYNLAGVWFDPYQAKHLAEQLRKAGIRCNAVQQTHATRGPKDTALYEMVSNKQLVLYDHPELRNAVNGASARELGNGLLFLTKATGRAKIDLLIALSNVANEVLYRPRYGPPRIVRYA